MKTLKINDWDQIPENFTGIAEFLNRDKFWYKDGKPHREDGPAKEYSNGTKVWYKEGLYHRENGPAYEYLDGSKVWYKEGKLHRINGPAREYKNGYPQWWIDSKIYSSVWLQFLVEDSIYLGKEKGKYDLDWLRFLTEKGIKEFPIVARMEQDNCFIPLFNKVFGASIT